MLIEYHEQVPAQFETGSQSTKGMEKETLHQLP